MSLDSKPAYDVIGAGYSTTRRPDPRIARRIVDALGDAASVVNVGAGAGSYEPRDRRIVAVEPSTTMLRQRAMDSAPAVRGVAECLPFADGSFDAALAVLTAHHWKDAAAGFAEMRRVARRRIVILTWDPEAWESFWLVREYFPTCAADRSRSIPLSDIAAALGECRIEPVPIPHDCADGFYGAFWRRPDAYLDARVRSGISTFAAMPAGELDRGLARLASDLRSGAWPAEHRDLLDREELDLGYRLVVA